LAPRKREEVEKYLQRKGFRLTETDHHKLIYYTTSGYKTRVWTKTSRGSSHKDISDVNLSHMAKQCYLSKRDFIALLECPLSREKYEEKLISEGYIKVS